MTMRGDFRNRSIEVTSGGGRLFSAVLRTGCDLAGEERSVSLKQ